MCVCAIFSLFLSLIGKNASKNEMKIDINRGKLQSQNRIWLNQITAPYGIAFYFPIRFDLMHCKRCQTLETIFGGKKFPKFLKIIISHAISFLFTSKSTDVCVLDKFFPGIWAANRCWNRKLESQNHRSIRLQLRLSTDFHPFHSNESMKKISNGKKPLNFLNKF